MTDLDLIALAEEHGASIVLITGTLYPRSIQFTTASLAAFCAALSAAQPKADERGSAEPFPYSKPLAELVPIGFASVVDLEAYAPMLQLGPHLPGVRDMAMFTKDQLKAACNAAHPDSAQARDAAQAVELTDAQVVAFAKEHQWKLSEHYGATVFQFRLSGLLPFARAIERAVLAKNGLGGKQ